MTGADAKSIRNCHRVPLKMWTGRTTKTITVKKTMMSMICSHNMSQNQLSDGWNCMECPSGFCFGLLRMREDADQGGLDLGGGGGGGRGGRGGSGGFQKLIDGSGNFTPGLLLEASDWDSVAIDEELLRQGKAGGNM